MNLGTNVKLAARGGSNVAVVLGGLVERRRGLGMAYSVVVMSARRMTVRGSWRSLIFTAYL